MKQNRQDGAEVSEHGISLSHASHWRVPFERVRHHVCFVVYPGFQLMPLLGLVAVFQEATNLPSSGVDYGLHFMSDNGRTISSSCGLDIATESLNAIRADTVLVMVGSLPSDATIDHQKIAAIANCEAVRGCATRIGGVFAEASCYKPDSVDNYVWTSVGITAGVEMALAMVAEDNGAKSHRLSLNR